MIDPREAAPLGMHGLQVVLNIQVIIGIQGNLVDQDAPSGEGRLVGHIVVQAAYDYHVLVRQVDGPGEGKEGSFQLSVDRGPEVIGNIVLTYLLGEPPDYLDLAPDRAWLVE